MAKIYINRAYIESDGEETPTISVTYGNEVFEFECERKAWIYTIENDDKDLVINNSAGMEKAKWNHIIKEILDE